MDVSVLVKQRDGLDGDRHALWEERALPLNFAGTAPASLWKIFGDESSARELELSSFGDPGRSDESSYLVFEPIERFVRLPGRA